jgi:glutaredoxin
MKRFNLIILTLTLLLSQMGMLDHVYSEHQSGEVCDYCISAPSLDNAITSSVQTDFSNNTSQQHYKLTQESLTANTIRFYAARAPPRVI